MIRYRPSEDDIERMRAELANLYLGTRQPMGVYRLDAPAMTSHYRLLPIIVAAILGMGAAAGVLTWVAWRWTERGR